jgi:hypothetical protein
VHGCFTLLSVAIADDRPTMTLTCLFFCNDKDEAVGLRSVVESVNTVNHRSMDSVMVEGGRRSKQGRRAHPIRDAISET